MFKKNYFNLKTFKNKEYRNAYGLFWRFKQKNIFLIEMSYFLERQNLLLEEIKKELSKNK